MMMTLQIFSITFVSLFLFSVAEKEECKSCADNINSALNLASSIISGLEPIIFKDKGFCKTVTIIGVSKIGLKGDVCIINEPAPSVYHRQHIGILLQHVHVECHIGTLKKLSKKHKALEILEDLSSSLDEQENNNHSLVIDGKNVIINAVFKIDFEEGNFNFTKLEIVPDKSTNLKIDLKGYGLLTQLLKSITDNVIVKKTINFLFRFIFNLVLGKLKNNENLADILSLLNCGSDEY